MVFVTPDRSAEGIGETFAAWDLREIITFGSFAGLGFVLSLAAASAVDTASEALLGEGALQSTAASALGAIILAAAAVAAFGTGIGGAMAAGSAVVVGLALIGLALTPIVGSIDNAPPHFRQAHRALQPARH